MPSRNQLAASFPRALDFQHFTEEPLDFLADARRIHGDFVVIREDAPVFSRTDDCAGVVAVFGLEHQRAVLSEIESYALPISAALQLGLPENLVNLNHSLHSMRGDMHAAQKRQLMQILGESNIMDYHHSVCEALVGFAQSWRVGSKVGLFSEMRNLALRLSSRVLFGEKYGDSAQLISLLQSYFQCRREETSKNQGGRISPERLIAVGYSLDDTLREYTRECRQGRVSSGGILGSLATLGMEKQRTFSEDEVIGHSNVLFISSTEPVATALTWILLILSQLPMLRSNLRKEIAAIVGSGDVPGTNQLSQMRLLDGVINESLRLLPPNAFMVRITTKSTMLNGLQLPEHCEVILCPFLAHRDIRGFHQPNAFIPERWKQARPSSFEFFPFGAGGHSCVGRSLAFYFIKLSLSYLLMRYDLVLAGDQWIDWRLHIMFMPRTDPVVSVLSTDTTETLQSGKLNGPVANLMTLIDT